MSYEGGTYADPEIIDYATLRYADIGELDAFCESAVKMFREQEELQHISEAAVSTESVLFPQVLLYGGVPGFSFAEEQTYDLRTVEPEELSRELKDAYMCYMFQFESWNITTDQYWEWGAAYEERIGEWENEDGSGFTVKFYGNVTDFGREPSVEFYDLRDCYYNFCDFFPTIFDLRLEFLGQIG